MKRSTRRNRDSLSLGIGLACLVGAAAAGAEPAERADHTQSALPKAAQITPSQWPEVHWPLPRKAAVEQRIDELLETMSLEAKVGQMIQADIASVTPEQVRHYRLGSVLAGGNSSPDDRYNASPQEWLDLADDFWEASMNLDGDGPSIPLLFGIDAVHGHNNVVGATIFPHNVGLGAMRNPEMIREIARVTALEVRTTGMDWTFAPSIPVPRDLRWGRTYEGYAEHPELVAAYSDAMVEGLQGAPGDEDFLGASRILATAKHFIGDGGTVDGRDQGDARISETELRDIHNAGYPPAIERGVQTVMASFNSFNGIKLHGHHGLLTEVLKEQMNFDGFVVGDWNGHGQIDGCSNTDCPQAVLAGVDMLMAPDSWRGLYYSLLEQVETGIIPVERVDDAVRRILRVKLHAGLFDTGRPSSRPHAGQFELLAADEHRELARQAVRESLVLLKNSDGLLPLSPDQRILVAGDGADSMSKQSGGWTLTWQGTGTERADFPNGTTLWEGFKEQITAAGGVAELAIDGNYEQQPDAAIVVFGEDPYAEFQGDLPTLQFNPGDDSHLQLMQQLKEQDIPVVAVYIGGRPLWLNREINASDAFVAAWLPGSEGAGVADVLLADNEGRARHDFSGRLAFSWPANAAQYDLNAGVNDDQALFAYGHGLRYDDDGSLAALSEDPGVADDYMPSGVWFSRGAVEDRLAMVLVGGDGEAVNVTRSSASSADGQVSLSAIDHRAQEDARLVEWHGEGRFELVAEDPMQLDRETNAGLSLTFLARIDRLPESREVSLKVDCGTDCSGELALGEWLESIEREQWLRIGVPLRCLRVAGADMDHLLRPLVIQSDAGLSLALTEIALSMDSDSRLDCPVEP